MCGRRQELKAGYVVLSDGAQQALCVCADHGLFMVRMMTIEGASPVVDKGLRAMLPVELPASSFDIDLVKLRERVLKLDAVQSVDLRI